MTIRLKPSPGPTESFSFDAHSPSSSSSEPYSLPSPPTSWLSARDMKVFGARPLTSISDIGLVKCNECGKPVLRSSIADHADTCAIIRSGGKKGVKSKPESEDLKNGKKRKASPSPDEPAKKKNKPTPKVTKGRMKGPVDYDKQCGVINDKGLPCSRSLTCKSHSMGAKRSVEGRSRKYDDLLLEWQRANNPNFVEPVKRETKAEKKQKKEKEKLEKKRLAGEAATAMGLDVNAPAKKSATTSSTKKTSKKAAAAVRMAVELKDDVSEDLEELDSEVEIEDLVKSIKVSRDAGLIGTPLAVPCDASSWFVQRRERARCCRDLLINALGSGGSGAPGGITTMGLVSRTTSMGSNTPGLRLA